jgi:hypothetical protein
LCSLVLHDSANVAAGLIVGAVALVTVVGVDVGEYVDCQQCLTIASGRSAKFISTEIDQRC